MPSAAAPRRSPCSARRLRSRQVIWKIGSMPFCTRKCAAARLERCTLAPAPSVTFTAVARPLSGSARRRNSAGSVDTGGVISAVTTNSPPRSLECSSLAARRSDVMEPRILSSRHARASGPFGPAPRAGLAQADLRLSWLGESGAVHCANCGALMRNLPVNCQT